MPANPYEWQVLTAVQDALEGIDGTGDYAHDLDSRVALGAFEPSRPPFETRPCAAVILAEVSETDGPDLPGHEVALTVLVQGWATAATDSAGGRTLAGIQLLSDVRTALIAARLDSSTALYSLYAFDISASAVDGRQAGLSFEGGYLAAQITATYHRAQGQGE